MRSMLIIAFVILLIIIVQVFKPKGFVRSKAGKSGYSTVQLAHINTIFEQIETHGREGSFAVLIFNTRDRSAPNEALNLQFSIRNSRVGFDWVLLTPRNIEDRDRFVQFAESQGYTVLPVEDTIRSLRVEDGNLPMLCMAVMQKLYKLFPNDKVYLFTEGFEWQQ